MARIDQKFCGGKKLAKFVFGYFKTKKKAPTAIKLWRGGLDLNGPAIKKITFFRLPLPSDPKAQKMQSRKYFIFGPKLGKNKILY